MTIEKKQCFSIEKCVPIDFQYNNSGDFDPKRTTNAQDPHHPKVDFFSQIAPKTSRIFLIYFADSYNNV